MTPSNKRRFATLSARLLAAIGLSVALSGCVIEPLYGPHYYRPYRAYYGY